MGNTKIYVDKGRIFREFKVREHVFLKLKAKKISMELGACLKWVARYYGSFGILIRIGLVTYSLAFPFTIKSYNVFHVSLLKIYAHDPNHVTDPRWS